MAYQANESFHSSLDGLDLFVAKGEVFPDGHPVVKLDTNGLLFSKLFSDTPPPKAVEPKVEHPRVQAKR